MTDPLPEPLEDRADTQDGAGAFFHGTAVAVEGQGLLILGPSASGKSTLALALLALGAELISDDGVWLAPGTPPTLHRPDTAPPLIEARGIGLLNAGPIRAEAPLAIVADLSRPEADRLPPRRLVTFDGVPFPLILGASHPSLAPSLSLMLRHGRSVP